MSSRRERRRRDRGTARGASDVARRRSRSSQRGCGGPGWGCESPRSAPLGEFGVRRGSETPACMRGFVTPRPWRLLADASGSKRRAWSATLRRRRRSSRSLVDMPPAMKRLTVESMSVRTDESHAEAFREVGLEHMIGAETRLEFTTLGRSKLVESACIIVGEPERRESTSMFYRRSTSSRPCPSSKTTTPSPGST